MIIPRDCWRLWWLAVGMCASSQANSAAHVAGLDKTKASVFLPVGFALVASQLHLPQVVQQTVVIMAVIMVIYWQSDPIYWVFGTAIQFAMVAGWWRELWRAEFWLSRAMIRWSVATSTFMFVVAWCATPLLPNFGKSTFNNVWLETMNTPLPGIAAILLCLTPQAMHMARYAIRHHA